MLVAGIDPSLPQIAKEVVNFFNSERKM